MTTYVFQVFYTHLIEIQMLTTKKKEEIDLNRKGFLYHTKTRKSIISRTSLVTFELSK